MFKLSLAGWVAATSALALAACTSAPSAPHGAQTPIDEGNAAVAARDCRTARVKAREAMKEHVEPDALFLLGECDEIEGQPNDAIEEYRHALDIDPRKLDISLRLATLYLDLGRNEEALQTAKAASALSPERPEPYAMMAEAYERLGDQAKADRAFASAAAAFHNAVAAHPDDAKLRNRYAHALAMEGKDMMAKSEYLDALGLAGDDAEVLEEAAMGLGTLGENQGCIDGLGRALAHAGPLRARVLAERARCKHAAKDVAGACADADDSLAIAPDALLHMEVARWREQLGDRLACAAHYRAAAKLTSSAAVVSEANLGASRCGG